MHEIDRHVVIFNRDANWVMFKDFICACTLDTCYGSQKLELMQHGLVVVVVVVTE